MQKEYWKISVSATPQGRGLLPHGLSMVTNHTNLKRPLQLDKLFNCQMRQFDTDSDSRMVVVWFTAIYQAVMAKLFDYLFYEFCF